MRDIVAAGECGEMFWQVREIVITIHIAIHYGERLFAQQVHGEGDAASGF